MNHHIQIMQCGRVFHMQRIDHHTLVQSYLDMFRSWQENKKLQKQLDVKNPPHKSLSQLSCWHEGYNKFMSCQMIKTDTKSCHASNLHLKARSAVRLHMMAKKRKTKDKEADLLHLVLLRGKSCFDSK